MLLGREENKFKKKKCSPKLTAYPSKLPLNFFLLFLLFNQVIVTKESQIKEFLAKFTPEYMPSFFPSHGFNACMDGTPEHCGSGRGQIHLVRMVEPLGVLVRRVLHMRELADLDPRNLGPGQNHSCLAHILVNK